ncbi:MAG: nucleoside-diphosphate-sugar epimerase [Idiomarinaceae bacterium HL-53]|nr:MAG: nucleoside-diphosphate-sugar epimerase [Idiomarinaceae bacterium HL-53]CUS48430.1 Nucleoside-diphosphate-sugar epimerase [Idiomarinaceae bacterium HL-53]
MQRLTWIGFGDVAQHTVPLLTDDFHVAAVKRTPVRLPNRVTLVQGDAKSKDFLFAHLRDFLPTHIVISLSPREYSEAGYVEAYLKPVQNLVACLTELEQTPRILFVSSTSVYEQLSGEWVDETAETKPQGHSGRVMLQCEETLEAYTGQSLVARASGIYGPGRRRLLQQIESGQVSLNSNYTNRIHAEDLAGAIVHLIQQPTQENHDTFIITDSTPTPQFEVMLWLAGAMKVQLPESLPISNAPSARGGNKRLSNRKLLATGFKFRYPSYQDGYQALLSQR